jgi:hypothetical protein
VRCPARGDFRRHAVAVLEPAEVVPEADAAAEQDGGPSGQYPEVVFENRRPLISSRLAEEPDQELPTQLVG